MDFELELTKEYRLKLARVFQKNKKVDYSIDCVIEGQMGKAFVDDVDRPTAYRITIGPFWYFSGNSRSPGSYKMMKGFPTYSLLMPSPPEWLKLAQELYGNRLVPLDRYSFSTANLSAAHLESILSSSPHRDNIVSIDAKVMKTWLAQPDSYLELSDFDSTADFIIRGFGYAVKNDDEVKGVAYSSLVCSKGIEVSLYVSEKYRHQGVATALGSKLVLECMNRGLRPNWDAANPESCKLALKLGFIFTETYQAYYYAAD